MEAYIRGIGNISPQSSWDNELFPSGIIKYEGNRLRCIEPDYKEYIAPIKMRRMSRTLKMGVSAAGKCLRDAEVDVPGAIIIGTGLGMIADTEKFLRPVIDNGETLLTPTSFIQSTHNTVGAHIAVMLKCNKYNLTYVSDYLSFENALLDSMIRIKENPDEKVLLAGIDEMTDSYFKMIENGEYIKKGIDDNYQMLKHDGKGWLAGEGAAFFMVTGKEHPENYAKFTGVSTFYKPESDEEVDQFILGFLNKNGLETTDLDLVISGLNGDPEGDEHYIRVQEGIFRNNAFSYYKHMCGEYYTASSFAAWLGAMIIKRQSWHEGILLNNTHPELPIKNILIYNQHNNIQHGLILLTAC